MNLMIKSAFVLALALPLASAGVFAKNIWPMYGGLLIDGYNMQAMPTGPKGSIAYDAKKNVFKGSYTGLQLPKGRGALFAWLHDTVNQRTTYLGPVGWWKRNNGGMSKGRFTIKVPSRYKGGKFGTNEIIAFTAEKTGFLKGTKVVTKPSRPSGNGTTKWPNPAFYLFSALPGADTNIIYCGHGQDFAFAKAPNKQICYDCICGQKYSSCITAGLRAH